MTGEDPSDVDVLVLREGTEGLSMGDYAEELRAEIPDRTIRLARTPAEEGRYVEHAPVVTGVRVTEDLLDRATDLRLFACAFSGYEHLPMDALEERGVAVTNAAGIHAPGIAEQVIGQMLVFARRLDEGWRRSERREWRHYQAFELVDSTVTIVGLGSIGTAVARRLEGFEVDTIGVRYTPSKGGPTDEVIGFDTEALHDALARTGYLVVASPLTETTSGLIGREEFLTLPVEAVVVNVARGPIVRTEALVEAIRMEHIRGAALDVTDPEPLPRDHPLWSFENVHVTPHMGGHTPKHWARLADILARNLERVDETGSYGDLENQVLSPGD